MPSSVSSSRLFVEKCVELRLDGVDEAGHDVELLPVRKLVELSREKHLYISPRIREIIGVVGNIQDCLFHEVSINRGTT